MLNFNNAILNNISLHYVGNKGEGEELINPEQQGHFDTFLTSKLRDYFLNRFVSTFDQYVFSHTSDLKYNEVYNFARHIFNNDEVFLENAVNIATHLYNNSVHPRIKHGELYVCRFTECIADNRVAQAVGIFKTETKSPFLEVDVKPSEQRIEYKEGVDLSKFDKGCLIFDLDEEEGYLVYILDNQNKGEEAQYWKQDFLGLNQKSNEFQQTNQFLSITKNYVTNQLAEDFQVSKTDKIDLLNRSVAFFKNNETFDKEVFEKEVLYDEKVISSFRKYDESYRNENAITLEDSFDISPQAVKKQARVFKSVLKLDKNFHVYIHGNKDLIERGTEADGRKYYKIYFNEEN